MLPKKIIFIFIAISSMNAALCQKKNLKIIGIEGLKLNYPKIVNDSSEAKIIGKLILNQLNSLSYLSSTIDKTSFEEDSYTMHLKKGEKVEWAKLRNGNLTDNELSAIDYNDNLFFERPFNSKQLNRFFERTIRYFENSGYPFASIRLDSIQFNEKNKITANLNITKNTYYVIDSIALRGNSNVNKQFLEQYLGISEGEPYNERKIKAIEIRLSEIPFIKVNKKPEIQYFENNVKIVLDLNKKNASRFDGILGLLTNEETGKIELTGDVDLNLINAFKRGENIRFNWRKLKGNSQELDLNFALPYIFRSQFGVDFNFELFKRDTTFIDLITRFGVNYILERGEKISLYVENKSSSLLSKNNLIIQNIISTPALGDVKINAFGIGYQSDKTNYKYNPTKGLQTNLNFTAGRKRLRKIAALEELRPAIYEGIELNSNQYFAKTIVNYFIRINSRNTFKIGNKTATINSENLYQNELLRIGGLKVLRGFDEESINASTYSVSTLEYRFLLDQNSYFSLFYDKAFYENKNVDGYNKDDPYGIGAGVSFETKAGIFTFNYAVGQQFNNPIQVKAAKIHFGFINFF